MDSPALIVQLRRGREAPPEELRFERSPVHIGRGPRNELLIDHAFVSHQHGVLHFDESGVDFVDLGSTNGSYLDGVRLGSRQFATVHSGAELGIGNARLRVKLDVRGHRMEPAEPAPSTPLPTNASLEGGAHATYLAAVIERFAASFLALSRGQRAWRERLGLPKARRAGLDAMEDPLALIAYLLAPGHEASRIEELEVACEELLCNERALVRALANEALACEEP